VEKMVAKENKDSEDVPEREKEDHQDLLVKKEYLVQWDPLGSQDLLVCLDQGEMLESLVSLV
jgi:hypothetical protein